MHFLRLMLLCGMLCTGTRLFAVVVSVSCVPHTVASREYVAQALAAGRCFATETDHSLHGMLCTGVSAAPLVAGRYRLHVPLAMAPLSDLNTSAISITIMTGNTHRSITMLNFPVADEFVDCPVDFVIPGGTTAPFSVGWSLESEQAKKNKTAATQPEAPKDGDLGGPDAEPGGLILEDELPKPDGEGMIAVKELGKIHYHLAATGIHIERLCPVAVTAVTTNKVVYAPGEKGAISVALENTADILQKVSFTLELVSGLVTTTPLHDEVMTLAPGEKKLWTGTLATDNLAWGTDLQAKITTADGLTTMGATTFSVTKNFWETAFVKGIMFTDLYADPHVAEESVREARAQGFTAFECFFWAPDEFGDFTPDSENYLSAQTQYRESVSGTKNLIRFAHANGMASTVYSNLWGSDGPAGFELMRKHPEWFSGADVASDWLENWPIMEKGVDFQVWPESWLFQDARSLPAMQVHAETLIASHNLFGWDATRYDSYYSSEWTKKATAKVRELVEKSAPNYQWGYNSFATQDEQVGALDIMVGGGGLIMEEASREVAKHPSPFSTYIANLTSYRDLVWPHHGHLGLCYDPPRKSTPLDALYLTSMLLACGCHPYYGTLEDQLGPHAQFALRYAELLYNNRARPLKDAAKVITLPPTAQLSEWQHLARTVDMGARRHRLVLHLLPSPVVDSTLTNFAMKLQPPLRKFPLGIKLPANAVVTGAWDLCPTAMLMATPLERRVQQGTLALTIPEVRFWNIIVIDYDADEGVQ